MGHWYTIGLFAGLGTAFGIASTGVLRRAVFGFPVAAVIAVALALAFDGTAEAVAGAVGAACGAFGSAPLIGGALRRGGTRGGTAVLLAVTSIVAAAIAFIPIVGYLEAIAVPVLGFRVRRRAPDRHAGLRTLA